MDPDQYAPDQQDTELEVKVYAKLVCQTPADRKSWILRKHLIVPSGGTATPSSMKQAFELFRLETCNTTYEEPFPEVYSISLAVSPGQRRPASYLFTGAYLKMDHFCAADCGTTNGVFATADFDVPDSKTLVLLPPRDQTKHMLLITGQLSGCTVCWRRAGTKGALIIAHLQPKQGLTGLQLQTNLIRHGLLQGQRVEAAYGRIDYGEHTHSAHLFGVWTPAQAKWRFFAQTRADARDKVVYETAEIEYQ